MRIRTIESGSGGQSPAGSSGANWGERAVMLLEEHATSENVACIALFAGIALLAFSQAWILGGALVFASMVVLLVTEDSTPQERRRVPKGELANNQMVEKLMPLIPSDRVELTEDEKIRFEAVLRNTPRLHSLTNPEQSALIKKLRGQLESDRVNRNVQNVIALGAVYSDDLGQRVFETMNDGDVLFRELTDVELNAISAEFRPVA